MPPCLMTTPPRGAMTKRKWNAIRHGAEESTLAKRLRADVLWGRMPAYKAQQYAHDAMVDGARPTPLLKRMGKIGCGGKHPSGCWPDFCKLLPNSFAENVLTYIPIPLKSEDNPGDLQIALPHAFFSAIYHANKADFASIMYDSDQRNLNKFWNSQRDHPLFRGHCMHHHPHRDFREFAIPFGLHGDEVATVGCGKAWAKLSHCVSWASLLGTHKVEDNRQIIFQIYACLCKGMYGNDTLDEISRTLVWSLNALYAGVWPSQDVDGNVYTSGPLFEKAGTFLAEGYYAIWWATQVDLDYMCKAWKGAKYGTNAEPCNSCSCNATTKPWGDCRKKLAVWLKHCWTNHSYASSHPDRHQLFRDVPSGGIMTYIPDVLHVKHLGTDPSFYGSAVHLLTHHHMPGNPETNLTALFKLICIEYKRKRIRDRFPKLKPTMVKQAKAKLPLLKGKAGKIKAFGFALVGVFQQLMNPSDPKHNIVLKGLRLSVRIDVIMRQYAAAYRYPQDVAEEFEACCFDYCRITCALINAYHKAEPPVPVFNYTIKAHYLMHLGVCARYTNPSFGSCYQGETLMQTCKSLFQASCDGSAALAACNTAMYRFVMARALGLGV